MADKPLIGYFHDDIEDVLEKYFDMGLTIGEAVGTLDIIKMNIWAVASATQSEGERFN